MIEVTSRHMVCTHFNLDYSRMPAVALQWFVVIEVDTAALQYTRLLHSDLKPDLRAGTDILFG